MIHVYVYIGYTPDNQKHIAHIQLKKTRSLSKKN